MEQKLLISEKRVACDAPAETRLSLVQCQHFDVKRVICATPFNTLGKQNTLAPSGIMHTRVSDYGGLAFTR
jgi:hypothetical protein